MLLLSELPDEPELPAQEQQWLTEVHNNRLTEAVRAEVPHLETVVNWPQAKNGRVVWDMIVLGITTYSMPDYRNAKKHNVAVLFGRRTAIPVFDNWSAVFFEGAIPMYAIHTENGGEVKADTLSYYGKKSAFWRFMQRYFEQCGIRVLNHNWEDW